MKLREFHRDDFRPTSRGIVHQNFFDIGEAFKVTVYFITTNLYRIISSMTLMVTAPEDNRNFFILKPPPDVFKFKELVICPQMKLSKPGYSSYRAVILTINIILPTTFQHIYWYTVRVSDIKWSSLVVVKSLLYGSLFGNTVCVIIQYLCTGWCGQRSSHHRPVHTQQDVSTSWIH
jgi:hypothetical protein